MIAHTKARPESDNGWKRSRLALPNTNNPNKGRQFFPSRHERRSLVCRKLSSLYYDVRINDNKKEWSHMLAVNRACCHSWSVTMSKKGSIIGKLQTKEKAGSCLFTVWSSGCLQYELPNFRCFETPGVGWKCVRRFCMCRGWAYQTGIKLRKVNSSFSREKVSKIEASYLQVSKNLFSYFPLENCPLVRQVEKDVQWVWDKSEKAGRAELWDRIIGRDDQKVCKPGIERREERTTRRKWEQKEDNLGKYGDGCSWVVGEGEKLPPGPT